MFGPSGSCRCGCGGIRPCNCTDDPDPTEATLVVEVACPSSSLLMYDDPGGVCGLVQTRSGWSSGTFSFPLIRQCVDGVASYTLDYDTSHDQVIGTITYDDGVNPPTTDDQKFAIDVGGLFGPGITYAADVTFVVWPNGSGENSDCELADKADGYNYKDSSCVTQGFTAVTITSKIVYA